MASPGVGNTALGAAICRLIEQSQPDNQRLFNDPVVQYLVSPALRLMMRFGPMRNLTFNQTEAAGKGIYGGQVCRTRYIDEIVQSALVKGITQLVILGAGLDSRPYRLPGIERVKIYEVDLASVQNAKKSNLESHFGRLPANVTFIPIDFDTQTLETIFADSTFDHSKPAIFIWEAVTQYISADAVRQTLNFIGKSAPGSVLVFTYVLKSVIERRSTVLDADKIMDRVQKTAPWKFGLEPSEVNAFLQPFHLQVQADVGSTDYQAKYLQPINRTLYVSEMERTVHAVVSP